MSSWEGEHGLRNERKTVGLKEEEEAEEGERC